MLDLQAGVHFEEVEALVLAGDKLHRAGGIIIDRLGESHRLRAHRGAGRGIEQGRRRLLDDLLIAALDRTFALAEMNHIAVAVAEHLDFDVARIDDEFLDEHAVVAKRRRGLGLRARKTLDHFVGLIGDAHALAAAARRRLQHYGIADFIGDPDGFLAILDHAEIARHDADIGLRGEFLGFDLVAHRLDGAGVGTDEDDIGVGQRRGEGRPFGQESVAGMHRLGARALAGVDDFLDQQIGLRGRRRADMHGLVGHFDMQRVGVRVGINGDRGDAQPPGGLNDAAGDLATIGDQNFTKHKRPNFKRRARLPLPRKLAGADFIVF